VILLKYAEIEEALENIDNYASYKTGREKADYFYDDERIMYCTNVII